MNRLGPRRTGVLFVLWVICRAAPPPGAWLGAISAIAGTALIVSR